VKLTYGDLKTAQSLKVMADPAYLTTTKQMVAKAELFQAHYQDISSLNEKMYQLGEAKDMAELVKEQLAKQGGQEELIKKSEALLKNIEGLVEKINGPEDVQGLYRDSELVSSKLSAASRSLQDVIYPVTESSQQLVKVFTGAMEEIVQEIDGFLQKEWMTYRKELEAANFSLFTTFDK
jgi:hypothetical protein